MTPLRASHAGGSTARAVAVVVLATFLLAGPLGCLTTQVPPVGAQGPFHLERDEARLWEQAKEEERQLREKAPLYNDPILEDYLNDVARRLVPPEARDQGLLKIHVTAIKDPTLNAFTYPNGAVYIHTGLLARVENESELAMVLGHEITHATERHALRFTRSARNKMIGFSIASIIASIAVANAAGKKAEQGDWSSAYVINQIGNLLVNLGLQLGFLAAVNGYGRELEREADVGGLRDMVAAGYDPEQAPRVFELLKDDHGDSSKLEVFFFGSHPRLDERIASTRELVQTEYEKTPAPRVTDTREFQMRTRVLVRDDAVLNLNDGRYGHAEFELKRVLDLTPNDPVAHDVYGQLYEKQAAEAKDPDEAARLTKQALDKYEEASRLDSTYADPYRAIGILRYKAGDRPEALAAFKRYLELKPAAADAQQVKDYILELEAP
ncbi:MAG TPA: M48 family metalloprotease [Candidatus Polarisedimenticolia bacterium]|nr:M48 family metalloprotease [Candidatus Polarisedimenticolia bacterium]